MIADYPELIAEVSARSGFSDVVSRARMFVGMAENMLSKRLRLADMETVVELTTNATGDVSLPADYLEMRSIRHGSCAVDRIILPLVLAGRATGYAIQGKVLKSSFKNAPHSCVYYAAVPSLENANTNWLLDAEPEIYLQAVLFQVYTAHNEIEKAQITAGYLGQLISDAQDADRMNRRAGTRINFGNITP